VWQTKREKPSSTILTLRALQGAASVPRKPLRERPLLHCAIHWQQKNTSRELALFLSQVAIRWELPVSPFSSPAHARGSVACPPHGDSHSRTTTVVVSPRCRRRQSGRNGCQPTKSALWLANLPTPEAAHGQSNMPRRMLLPGHGHEFQQIDLGAANSSVPAASRSLDPTRSPLFPLQPAMARCHWRKW